MTQVNRQISRIIWILVALSRLVEAAPPVVSGLPTDIYLGENESTARLIYIYTIADPNSNSFVCTFATTGTPGTPTGTEFDVRKNTGTGNYELWSTGTATFDVATISAYTVGITCTDSNGESNTAENVVMTLKANNQLTVNDVIVSAIQTDVTLNALTTGAATDVKLITSSIDQAGHDVFYSLVNNPSFSPEFFTIDSSSGQIKTNRELKYIDAGTPTMYLTITARDETDQIQVYATQTVHFTNQNTIPLTTNMPLAESRLESLAAGTTLFKVSVTDPDSSQSHTYRYTCVPAAGEDTFTLDGSGNFQIATGMKMDYESISFYNCSFYIDDTIHEGGPFIYELTVLNDNDTPAFADTMYYATINEGATGSVSFTPGFTCTDEDSGETLTYDLQPNINNSDRFAVSQSTGVMTYNVDYDVDNSAMPTSVILTVYCKDSGGADGVILTGSAQVTITINDVNDNAPAFPATAYTISVNQFTSPGDVIGTLTATDADSGTNGEFTCAGVSTSTYGSYYSIASNCEVFLTKSIDFPYGTHVPFDVTATDKGNPTLTGTTALDIVYSETTTTTVATTTTTEYNFFDHGENIAMFVMTLLAGLAILAALMYCLFRFCCGGSACAQGSNCFGGQNRMRRRRYPPRQVTPDTPPRKRRPPSPAYREPTPPPKQRIIRTIAKPAPPPPSYWEGMPGYYGRPVPRPGMIRTAPSLPGLYR